MGRIGKSSLKNKGKIMVILYLFLEKFNKVFMNVFPIPRSL